MLRASLVAAAALVAAATPATEPVVGAGSACALSTAGSTTQLKVGETGRLVLVVSPKEPTWHIHPQAPLKLRVEEPSGLRVSKLELGRKDLVDPKAAAPRFEVPFVAVARGRHEARSTVDFFVCSDTACVKQVRTVVTPVEVK